MSADGVYAARAPDASRAGTFIRWLGGCTWPWYMSMFDRMPRAVGALLNDMPRGIGQVLFCNNPAVGFIFLAALSLSSQWYYGFYGVYAVLLNQLFAAKVFNAEDIQLKNGLHGYNGWLVGILLSFLRNPVDTPQYLYSLVELTLAVFTCTCLTITLARVFGPKIPTLTIPFNIAVLLFVCSTPDDSVRDFVPVSGIRPSFASEAAAASNAFDIIANKSTELPLGLDGFILGSLRGVSQIFVVDNERSAIVLLLAIAAFYSPISALLMILGSASGTAFGWLSGIPRDFVVSGGYGYNSALTSLALGMLLEPTWGSLLPISAIFAFLTAVVHGAMTYLFSIYNLPVISLPFNITTLAVLCMEGHTPHIHRVEQVTSPDLRLFGARYGVSTGAPKPAATDAVETGERWQQDYPQA